MDITSYLETNTHKFLTEMDKTITVGMTLEFVTGVGKRLEYKDKKTGEPYYIGLRQMLNAVTMTGISVRQIGKEKVGSEVPPIKFTIEGAIPLTIKGSTLYPRKCYQIYERRLDDISDAVLKAKPYYSNVGAFVKADIEINKDWAFIKSLVGTPLRKGIKCHPVVDLIVSL